MVAQHSRQPGRDEERIAPWRDSGKGHRLSGKRGTVGQGCVADIPRPRDAGFRHIAHAIFGLAAVLS